MKVEKKVKNQESTVVNNDHNLYNTLMQPSTSRCMNRDQKREHHNALERKRRNEIKDSYAYLKEVIPTWLVGEKASREYILAAARMYIVSKDYATTEQKNSIKLLKKQNNDLNTEIQLCKEAIKRATSRK